MKPSSCLDEMSKMKRCIRKRCRHGAVPTFIYARSSSSRWRYKLVPDQVSQAPLVRHWVVSRDERYHSVARHTSSSRRSTEAPQTRRRQAFPSRQGEAKKVVNPWVTPHNAVIVVMRGMITWRCSVLARYEMHIGPVMPRFVLRRAI